MRWLIYTMMPVLLLIAHASGYSSIALTPGKSGVDDVLDALQSSGKDVKTFIADVQMTTEDLVMTTSSTQMGKVWFFTKPTGDAAIHVAFDHKKIAGKIIPEQVEFWLDSGWLTQRKAVEKKETRFRMAADGQKVNLFQLGKGPFPLPIGQDKKDVHTQFDVTLVSPVKDDPANSIHLQLKPKPGTSLDASFFMVEAWIDCKTNMPSRMATENKKHSEAKTTDLTNLVPNAAVKPVDVEVPPLPADWTTVDK